MAFGPQALAHALRALAPGYPGAGFCIALSGGVDSTALLVAAAELARTEPPLRLRALHVDHGLQPESAQWAAHCERLCGALGIPLGIVRLGLVPGRGESIEAAARAARYGALAAALAPGEWLLTAHHQDDQLETVLIQLLRGAGVAGLSAMPPVAPLGQGWHGRPLLQFSRRELAEYAGGRGLDWIEDPMNASRRFDRGYLRSEILPLLRARWPAVMGPVARSARHVAAAQRLLNELAGSDASTAVDPEGRLSIAALAPLSRDRQANLVRWWIVQRGLGLPSTARLDAVLDEVVPAAEDANPVVSWATGEVRRHRGQLYAMQPLGPPPDSALRLPLRVDEPLVLPQGLGTLELVESMGEGLAPDRVGRELEVRFRAGGETLTPVGSTQARTLKNLLQEAGVVPWMRERMPLLYRDDRLVAVADRWVAADAASVAGTRGCRVVWTTRRGST